ncbi:hypothetical protein [Maribacter sp. 2210JD10-5]|uniref:hypothetical protein n=1 Tax=Maribacter sp. 2210JD10-5 TaxID=3386272 RepID=UPI0039BCFF2F
MRKWIIKQIEKFGLDSSNLKTEQEQKGRILKNGELEKIIFPDGLDNSSEWRVKEWFFEKGQLIRPGDIIGTVENKEQRFEFETFVGGKLVFFKMIGQKVEGGTILAEIKGE